MNNQAAPADAPVGYIRYEENGRLVMVKTELEAGLKPLMRMTFDELAALPGARLVSSGRAGPVHLPVPGSSRRIFIRPYGRGGLLARPGDRDFADPSRAFVELEVSCAASVLGLPVPELVGVTTVRMPNGMWRMEIWSWWMPDAIALSLCLPSLAANPAERRRLLSAVAVTLRRCHDAGLKHGDLNSRNIVVERIPGGWKVSVIDLDKASIGPRLTTRERNNQLCRLYRSLAKEGVIPASLKPVEFTDMVREYHPGEISRRRLAAFTARCQLAVFWHSISWKLHKLLGPPRYKPSE